MGAVFDGNWEANCREGHGQYSKSGLKIVGEWKSDEPYEDCTVELPNGNKYIGNIVNGKFEGQGTFLYSHGDLYKGSFKNGTFEGRGVLKYLSGEIYDGQFKEGKFHGKGQMDEGSSTYEGEWVNGLRHG